MRKWTVRMPRTTAWRLYIFRLCNCSLMFMCCRSNTAVIVFIAILWMCGFI